MNISINTEIIVLNIFNIYITFFFKDINTSIQKKIIKL